MKYIAILILLLLFACNPIPKEDSHPEVPLLADLLKDTAKFKKVIGTEQLREIVLLKNDKIILIPNQSSLPFKLIDVNHHVILEKVFDWKLPFYIDKTGNLYFDRQKYFYPDYKKYEDFKTVVIRDSLEQEADKLNDVSDSLSTKQIEAYEIKLLATYSLEPCENVPLQDNQCDVFEIRNGVLLVRQPELFKNDFAKQQTDIDKFDDDVLIKWNNGKLPNPVYLSYYQMGNQKFKCDRMTVPKMVILGQKKYLISPDFGLYQLL